MRKTNPEHSRRRSGWSVTELVVWLGAALFVGGALVLWWTGKQRASRPPAAQSTASETERGQAPGFELPLLGGGRVSLEGLRGRVVLVHFWATWCVPCVHEAPELARLASDFQGRPLSLVAINVDEDLEQVERFFGGESPPYLVALDPGGALARRYGTSKYPETYLLDREGRLLERYIGPQRWSDADIRATLEPLVSALAP